MISKRSSQLWPAADPQLSCRDRGDSGGGLLVSQDVPSSLAIYAKIRFLWVVCSSGHNLSYHLIMLDVCADSSLLDSLLTSNCLLTRIISFSFSYTHPECINLLLITYFIYLFCCKDGLVKS